MRERLIVQTEEVFKDTLTEAMKEHRSLTFALSKHSSEDSSVQFELLQVRTEVSTVLQDVQNGTLFQVTMFYVGSLLLEEGNKGFEFVKSYDFVQEQQFALHESLKKPCIESYATLQ